MGRAARRGKATHLLVEEYLKGKNNEYIEAVCSKYALFTGRSALGGRAGPSWQARKILLFPIVGMRMPYAFVKPTTDASFSFPE